MVFFLIILYVCQAYIPAQLTYLVNRFIFNMMPCGKETRVILSQTLSKSICPKSLYKNNHFVEL